VLHQVSASSINHHASNPLRLRSSRHESSPTCGFRPWSKLSGGIAIVFRQGGAGRSGVGGQRLPCRLTYRRLDEQDVVRRTSVDLAVSRVNASAGMRHDNVPALTYEMLGRLGAGRIAGVDHLDVDVSRVSERSAESQCSKGNVVVFRDALSCHLPHCSGFDSLSVPIPVSEPRQPHPIIRPTLTVNAGPAIRIPSSRRE
jgi:hypothetical protein